MTAKGDASRDRILRAAAEVVGRHGYEGATISRISTAAGLPASSIYWFFRSKEHLVGEVVRYRFDEWYRAQPGWGTGAPGTALDEALRPVLQRLFGAVLEAPEFLRVGQMVTLELRESLAKETYAGLRDSTLALVRLWLERICAAGGHRPDPGLLREVAQLVLVAADGLFLTQQSGRPVDLDSYVDLTVAAVTTALDAG